MPIFCCISLKIVIIDFFILTVFYHSDHFPLKYGICFIPKFAECKLFPLPFPQGTHVSVECAAVIPLNSSLCKTKSRGCLLLWAILKIAGRVYYVACACDLLLHKQWSFKKLMDSSMSTVIDPKYSFSQSGVFREMVEKGTNILNKDFYIWEFVISDHFLTCFYTSNESRNVTFSPL